MWACTWSTGTIGRPVARASPWPPTAGRADSRRDRVASSRPPRRGRTARRPPPRGSPRGSGTGSRGGCGWRPRGSLRQSAHAASTWDETRWASVSRPFCTTATAVSSQEDSMPRTVVMGVLPRECINQDPVDLRDVRIPHRLKFDPDGLLGHHCGPGTVPVRGPGPAARRAPGCDWRSCKCVPSFSAACCSWPRRRSLCPVLGRHDERRARQPGQYRRGPALPPTRARCSSSTSTPTVTRTWSP